MVHLTDSSMILSIEVRIFARPPPPLFYAVLLFIYFHNRVFIYLLDAACAACRSACVMGFTGYGDKTPSTGGIFNLELVD